jgi:hypothetical protein
VNPSRLVPSLSTLLACLALGSGCSALEAPLDWVVQRVSAVFPQEAPVEAAPQADPVAAATTGEATQSQRTETPAGPDPVEVEDWPELVDCGMG